MLISLVYEKNMKRKYLQFYTIETVFGTLCRMFVYDSFLQLHSSRIPMKTACIRLIFIHVLFSSWKCNSFCMNRWDLLRRSITSLYLMIIILISCCCCFFLLTFSVWNIVQCMLVARICVMHCCHRRRHCCTLPRHATHVLATLYTCLHSDIKT